MCHLYTATKHAGRKPVEALGERTLHIVTELYTKLPKRVKGKRVKVESMMFHP